MTTALTRHLSSWFGAWPATTDRIAVVAAARRDQPGWDGNVRPLLGALRPDGSGALVVSPSLLEDVTAVVEDLDADGLDGAGVRTTIGELVHGPGARLGLGVMRWIETGDAVAAADPDVASAGHDLDRWLDHDDPRVPPWLHPFGGDVLVTLDDDVVAAGVGVKRHDEMGHELAVVTGEAHRGRGLARRLVATAARRQLTRVPVVTYLHARENAASARVADAVGFEDRGWHVIGVFGGDAPG